MIRGAKRGILVTRLWYVNVVEPRTLLCTGITRDGNFLIENGKMTRPALNLRFNERQPAVVGAADTCIGRQRPAESVWSPRLKMTA